MAAASYHGLPLEIEEFRPVHLNVTASLKVQVEGNTLPRMLV
jgi:hypothetical protein